MRRIIITTGDRDGIGLEVTAKALATLGPRPGVQFILVRHPGNRANGLLRRLSTFQLETVDSLEDAFDIRPSSKLLIDVKSLQPEPTWVFDAAQFCLNGKAAGLVTGPLSKTLIKKHGFREVGHTEILKHVSGVQELFMGFVGSKFCVVLTTGHIPLKSVCKVLNRKIIERAAEAGASLRSLLPASAAKRKLAILGLNPHSGEEGLLGSEERRIISPAIASLKRKGLEVDGPVVPDTAFIDSQLRNYSIFICMYHDQGLIPFKTVHGFDEGFQITLGLPFVRTSVDHGTAKHLFGKNLANAGSMIAAINGAIKLTNPRAR